MYNVNTNPMQQAVPAQQPNYQQYMMNRPIYPIQQISLKGRPVASIEEARASIIDFDGSVFYFPDLANKCIYTKQMHKDKASQLQELEKYMQELTSDMVEMIDGASPEEKQMLSNRIAALATKIK